MSLIDDALMAYEATIIEKRDKKFNATLELIESVLGIKPEKFTRIDDEVIFDGVKFRAVEKPCYGGSYYLLEANLGGAKWERISDLPGLGAMIAERRVRSAQSTGWPFNRAAPSQPDSRRKE